MYSPGFEVSASSRFEAEAASDYPSGAPIVATFRFTARQDFGGGWLTGSIQGAVVDETTSQQVPFQSPYHTFNSPNDDVVSATMPAHSFPPEDTVAVRITVSVVGTPYCTGLGAADGPVASRNASGEVTSVTIGS
ncbi:MAG: hypothetical protein ABR548_06315 [Actinomycetota bacterium]|nr:hypothetical protein [Actinomycetota bacterium]